MELTVREVATLLDVSVRTVRARLARGELPGRKIGGSWRIRREHVPLTESQRRRLQGKAGAVRAAVDSALPSRLATSSGDSRRRLADIEAFRLGALLYREMRSQAPRVPRGYVLATRLERSLHDIADGVAQYDRILKLEALNQARSRLARLTADLLLGDSDPSEAPQFGWLQHLEGEILPALAGYARWVDRLGSGRERRSS